MEILHFEVEYYNGVIGLKSERKKGVKEKSGIENEEEKSGRLPKRCKDVPINIM